MALLLYAAVHYLPLFDDRAVLAINRISEAAEPRGQAARRVVLVSIDGLAPRVLAAVPTPTLDRLGAEGLRVEGVLTVVPSITLTSHASMLSGLPPEQHGVFFNRVEPWRELHFPTIFTDCAELGLRCGLFAGKRKFVHFAEHEPGVERYQFGASAAEVFRAALDYARERDPDFLFVHLAEVDLVGHAEGWGSDAQARAVAEIDAQLGSFIDALGLLPRPLAVLVTADHGGTGTSHHQDTLLNREIPWVLWSDGARIDPSRIHSTLATYAVVRRLLTEPER